MPVTIVPMADTGLMGAVGDAITSVLGWIGTVLTSLLTNGEALSPLMPLFAVGISISAIMLTVKIAKTFIWGA